MQYTPCPNKQGTTDFFPCNFYKYKRIFMTFRAQLCKRIPK